MRISLAIMLIALFATAFAFRTKTRLHTALKSGYGPRYDAYLDGNNEWQSDICEKGEVTDGAVPYPASPEPLPPNDCDCRCYWETTGTNYYDLCYNIDQTDTTTLGLLCGQYGCFNFCYESGY